MNMKSIFGKIFMILGILFVALLVYTRISPKTAKWNKETGIDVEQEFTKAYLICIDGKVKTFNVKSWRDYEYSDQIQFTTTDGVTFLTHASRLVLTNEKD